MFIPNSRIINTDFTSNGCPVIIKENNGKVIQRKKALVFVVKNNEKIIIILIGSNKYNGIGNMCEKVGVI